MKGGDFMCIEKESKTIAKKATIITIAGRELTGVTVMGPVKKVELGSGPAFVVRLYGKSMSEGVSSPWAIVGGVQDRDKRQILF